MSFCASNLVAPLTLAFASRMRASSPPRPNVSQGRHLAEAEEDMLFPIVAPSFVSTSRGWDFPDRLFASFPSSDLIVLWMASVKVAAGDAVVAAARSSQPDERSCAEVFARFVLSLLPCVLSFVECALMVK